MLSRQQIQDFWSCGFTAPGSDAGLAGELPGPDAFAQLLSKPGIAGDPAVNRHLDDLLTYKLCTSPAIIERVADLLGPDLLLWHSRYFDKATHAPPIPWHQDAPFWPIEPKLCVSAWLALDDAVTGNGCVYVVPGSNRRQLAHIASSGTGRFGMQADISDYDVGCAIPLELPRGEFFLFDCWLLHRSDCNRSRQPRLALSMQFIPPQVRVEQRGASNRARDFGVQLVKGYDRMQLNPVAPAPV